MQPHELPKLIEGLSVLDNESLNGDPMSFKGKIVVPFGADKILKVASTFDTAGDLQILREAERRGIDFYLQSEVLYQGVMTILAQPKIKVVPLPTVDLQGMKWKTLNVWCGETYTTEEEVIYRLALDQYGEEMVNKIKAFNEEFLIGNIYWRNIGVDPETGKIKCYDFQFGRARNEKGELRV